jgi:hypothetical protein
MLFKSPVYSEASGSIAGITYSHNRGGQYTRARVVPVNPGTPFQQAIRAFVQSLTAAWNNLLTDPEREAWNTYAFNVPILGPLGEPRNIGGLAHYIRSNIPRLQAGGLQIDAAPIIFNLGQATPPVATITAPSTASIAFTNTDEWYTVGVSGIMAVYASRPRPASINYFKGPYRFMGYIMTPDVNPKVMTLPFVVAAGQRIFLQARANQTDGRLSYPFRFQDDAA